MGFFDTTQQDLSQGLSVFYGELFDVGFLSGAKYYWDGFGDLAAYGHTYLGAANVVARSEIPFGIDDEAGDMQLTMSGVDATFVAAVRAEESEFYGRPITIWGQFFDEALQPSGTRFHIFTGVMDVPTYGGTGTDSRTISVPCEGEWTDRNTARNSLFSDMDQKRRFPGDRGLEYVYRYTPGVKRSWPRFH
jgi:hypothetical protein